MSPLSAPILVPGSPWPCSGPRGDLRMAGPADWGCQGGSGRTPESFEGD